jgi:gamma-glutamyl-gamma-aminobutyrate hydrolase PuuD
VLAVQWHPEDLAGPCDQALFDDLVARADDRVPVSAGSGR